MKHWRDKLSARSRAIPIRWVLLVPFVVQIVAAVGLTGWLSLSNGQRAVNELVEQLESEASSRIEDHLHNYLTQPHLIQQATTAAIQSGELDPDRFPILERYLWTLVHNLELKHDIYYSNAQGEILGIKQEPDGSTTVRFRDRSTAPYSRAYRLNNQGQRETLLSSPASDSAYDPRTRPWYKLAQATQEQTWSEIYAFVAPGDPLFGITAVTPFYEPTGQFRGVLATDVNLLQLNEFLSRLTIVRTGQSFILERTGNLVASSTLKRPFKIPKSGNKWQIYRVQASQSEDDLVRETAKQLIRHFGNLQAIEGSEAFTFRLAGERQFAQVRPFRHEQGIDWLIVVVVPASDFMTRINHNTRSTILLCVGALGLAILLGIYTSRWITRPIFRLSEASQAIANGQWNQTVDINRKDELGTLAQAFNQMAQQLRLSFTALEQRTETLEIRVQARTAKLRKANQKLQVEIAERKQVEQSLQHAKEVAEVANRAKSEFLASMSHELRTPLNGILGYTQVLQRTIAQPIQVADTSEAADANGNNAASGSQHLSPQTKERLQQGLTTIHQCGEHLLLLINDILDLSKIEARKMELNAIAFNLPSLIENINQLFSLRAAQKGISFRYTSLSSLPQIVEGDEQRLRQVLINLLSNAVKFTEAGGVVFKSSYGPAENSSAGKSMLCFQVEDTGIGIPADQLEEIFQPFQQGSQPNRSADGTGLGLAISQKLVRMMGGELKVKSTLAEGSLFWFELPLPEVERTSAARPEEPAILGFMGEPRTILVVDDRQENRAVLASLLSNLGFTVREAVDGEDCLHQVATSAPDTILMDLVMPGLGGLETTRQLRQSPDFKTIPIIATSASAFEQDQQQSLAAGCDAFLPKPLQIKALLDLLQQFLGLEWRYESAQLKGGQSVETAAEEEASLLVGGEATSPMAPPVDRLQDLYHMALIGDVGGILDQTKVLEQQDQQWVQFAAELRQLAKGFQIKKIQSLLQHHLDCSSEV